MRSAQRQWLRAGSVSDRLPAARGTRYCRTRRSRRRSASSSFPSRSTIWPPMACLERAIRRPAGGARSRPSRPGRTTWRDWPSPPTSASRRIVLYVRCAANPEENASVRSAGDAPTVDIVSLRCVVEDEGAGLRQLLARTSRQRSEDLAVREGPPRGVLAGDDGDARFSSCWPTSPLRSHAEDE